MLLLDLHKKVSCFHGGMQYQDVFEAWTWKRLQVLAFHQFKSHAV